MVALGLEEESLQGAPQVPGDLPPAKANLQVRVPGEMSEGSKWMEGISPHLILISFWGFSKGTKNHLSTRVICSSS